MRSAWSTQVSPPSSHKRPRRRRYRQRRSNEEEDEADTGRGAWSPRSREGRRESGPETPGFPASGLLCERVNPCCFKPPSLAESRAGGLDNLGNSDKEGSGLRWRVRGAVNQNRPGRGPGHSTARQGTETTLACVVTAFPKEIVQQQEKCKDAPRSRAIVQCTIVSRTFVKKFFCFLIWNFSNV